MFHIRLNHSEWDALIKNANACRLSRAAYIRKLVSGYVPKETPPFGYYRMTDELNAIGNNLNQLAYIANATGRVDADTYKDTVTQLYERLEEIENSLLSPDKL